MASSIAVWIADTNAPAKAHIKDRIEELHFNFWLLNQETTKEISYLDIGVKFPELSTEEAIKIYFPFQVDKDNYIPVLGKKVADDVTLLEGIFNTKVTSISLKNTYQNKIELDNGKKLTFHTFLDLKETSKQPYGVDYYHIKTGTILKFDHKLFTGFEGKENLSHETDSGTVENFYFRFRIKLQGSSKNAFFHRYKPAGNILLNLFQTTEIIDFRLNETRNLHSALHPELSFDSNISKIHFFLIREADSSFQQAHTNFTRCRLLENDLWEDYLNIEGTPDFKTPERMIIYHWKAGETSKGKQENGGAGIDHFTAFAKFLRVSGNFKTVLLVILTAVLLSVIGNVVSNYALEFLAWLLKRLLNAPS